MKTWYKVYIGGMEALNGIEARTGARKMTMRKKDKGWGRNGKEGIEKT